ATVHISATTKDVIHGFEIAGTNANMMLEPGYISTVTNTFKKAGEYTLVCNEYCGVGHKMMHATNMVEEYSIDKSVTSLSYNNYNLVMDSITDASITLYH